MSWRSRPTSPPTFGRKGIGGGNLLLCSFSFCSPSAASGISASSRAESLSLTTFPLCQRFGAILFSCFASAWSLPCAMPSANGCPSPSGSPSCWHCLPSPAASPACTAAATGFIFKPAHRGAPARHRGGHDAEKRSEG